MNFNAFISPLAKAIGFTHHQLIVSLLLVAIMTYMSYTWSATQEGGGMRGYPLDYSQTGGGGIPFHLPVPQCNT